jgi:hypothetical protein
VALQRRTGAVREQGQRLAGAEHPDADGAVGVDGAQFEAAEGAEKETVRARIDGV